MNRQQRDDVRAIQQMTRWTLVTLQVAEQGLVPLKVLQRAVEPRVLEAMGPLAPRPPGKAPTAPHVGRLRVQLVHDELAHVACVAPKADGTPAAYVLEFGKPSDKHGWRITELTRVEERRLVGPEAAVQHETDTEPGARRLPEDLTGLLAATRQARSGAAEELERARSKAQHLAEQLSAMKGNTSAHKARRVPILEQHRLARRDVDRWQKALASIDHELKELHEVREVREIRQRVVDGDPLMRSTNGNISTVSSVRSPKNPRTVPAGARPPAPSRPTDNVGTSPTSTTPWETCRPTPRLSSAHTARPPHKPPRPTPRPAAERQPDPEKRPKTSNSASSRLRDEGPKPQRQGHRAPRTMPAAQRGARRRPG